MNINKHPPKLFMITHSNFKVAPYHLDSVPAVLFRYSYLSVKILNLIRLTQVFGISEFPLVLALSKVSIQS